MAAHDANPFEIIVKTLKTSHHPAALDALVSALGETGDESILGSVTDALLEHDDPAAQLSLLTNYHALPPIAQKKVTQSSKRFQKATSDLLRHPARQSRLNAIQFIRTMAGTGFLVQMVQQLASEDREIREAAAAAIKNIVENYLERTEHQDNGNPMDATERRLVLTSLEEAAKNYTTHRSEIPLRLMFRFGMKGFSLLLRHLRHQNPIARCIQTIVNGEPDVHTMGFLIYAIHHGEGEAGTIARVMLSQLQSPDAVKHIADFIASSNDSELEAMASAAEGLPWWPLLQKQTGQCSTDCLRQLLKMCRWIPDIKLKMEIAAAILKSEADALKKEAIETLCALGTQQARWKLLLVFDHASPEVQMHALNKIRTASIEEKTKLLTPLLSVKNEEIQRIVMREISRDSLQKYMASFDKLDPQTREKAARAIAKIDDTIVEELVKGLQSVSANSRMKSLQTLMLMGKQSEVEESILRLVGDQDEKVRATVVKALGFVGTAAAVRGLVEALKDPDLRVKANAIEAFESLRHPKVINLLIPLQHHPDNRVRGNAVKAMMVLGHQQEAMESVEEMLKDQDPMVRRTAVWILRECKPPRSVALLTQLLQTEKDEEVIKKVWKALEQIKGTP